MQKIILNDINLFGFHGCLKEEIEEGSFFKISLEIETDFSQCYITDKLSDTINYVCLYDIIKKEMKIRSNLIENLAQRIINKIKNKFKKITYIKIKICKLFPILLKNVGMTCVIIDK